MELDHNITKLMSDYGFVYCRVCLPVKKDQHKCENRLELAKALYRA